MIGVPTSRPVRSEGFIAFGRDLGVESGVIESLGEVERQSGGCRVASANGRVRGCPTVPPRSSPVDYTTSGKGGLSAILRLMRVKSLADWPCSVARVMD